MVWIWDKRYISKVWVDLGYNNILHKIRSKVILIEIHEKIRCVEVEKLKGKTFKI